MEPPTGVESFLDEESPGVMEVEPASSAAEGSIGSAAWSEAHGFGQSIQTTGDPSFEELFHVVYHRDGTDSIDVLVNKDYEETPASVLNKYNEMPSTGKVGAPLGWCTPHYKVHHRVLHQSPNATLTVMAGFRIDGPEPLNPILGKSTSVRGPFVLVCEKSTPVGTHYYELADSSLEYLYKKLNEAAEKVVAALPQSAPLPATV